MPSENSELQRWQDLALEAGRVFTPTSPIDERSLFAGRDEQVRLIIDAINQKGQHAILYGERGVGKTSLANVLSSFLGGGEAIIAPRVNCDSADSFASVWEKVFEQIELIEKEDQIGFGRPVKVSATNLIALVEEARFSPESVRRALTLLAKRALPIVIVDEFDRLTTKARRAFADTIKTLSDHAVGATVILVGVADSVEQLILEHASVERALVQIRMPRMSPSEIDQILTGGVKRLRMTIDDNALHRIEKLSQGLPHYAHLLGLYATRSALDRRLMCVDTGCVAQAIDQATGGSQQSIRSAYDIAVRSPRKNSLFADVLLACALAEPNELGFFAAQDVRDPMRKITGKRYEIPSFAQHLNDFCAEKRGPILQKSGSRRLFRYRFENPLLQPFIIMRGIHNGRISADILD